LEQCDQFESGVAGLEKIEASMSVGYRCDQRTGLSCFV